MYTFIALSCLIVGYSLYRVATKWGRLTEEESLTQQKEIFIKRHEAIVLKEIEDFAAQKLKFYYTNKWPQTEHLCVSPYLYDQGPGFLEVATSHGTTKHAVMRLTFYLLEKDYKEDLIYRIKLSGGLRLKIAAAVGQVKVEISRVTEGGQFFTAIRLHWRDNTKQVDSKFSDALVNAPELIASSRREADLAVYHSFLAQKHALDQNALAKAMVKWNLEQRTPDRPRFSTRPTWQEFKQFASKETTMLIGRKLYQAGILLDMDNHRNRGRPINVERAYAFFEGEVTIESPYVDDF